MRRLVSEKEKFERNDCILLKIENLGRNWGVNAYTYICTYVYFFLPPDLADAKFWVGAGPTPSPQGIRVPDENGKEQPLRRYDRKAIVLTLPGDVTIHQIGHFGVWCEAFAVDFGHVQIPQGLNVPPSLKMLGVSPQVSWKGFL